MTSVAVIGGGITGLTAAFRLKQRGFVVKIYEASARVGGVIQSLRKDGYLAEFGPNTCLETSPKITALVHDLGLDSRKMYSNPQAENRYIVRDGKPVLMPASQAGFLTCKLFSIGAKLALLREPFIGRAPANVEESLAEFVLRRLGQEFLDYAINPFVAGVYAGDPARLSVKYAFPKLHALEQKYGSLIVGQFAGARERKRSGEVSKQNAKKFSFDEGLQVLTDALNHQLSSEIAFQTPVKRVERQNDRWIVTSETSGQEKRHEHDFVLFVAPAHKLANIELKSNGVLDTTPLQRVTYPPVTSIVFGFRREDVAHPCNGFGALIPEVERFNSLGVIFSSALFPNRAPQGHITLTSYVGGMRNPKLPLEPWPVIRKAVLEDLQKLLGVKGEPTFENHFVFRKAIPQYEVGYGRVKECMDQIEKQAPGFFFAGHYRDGIALGDSILSGENIAERIANFVADSKSTQSLATAA